MQQIKRSITTVPVTKTQKLIIGFSILKTKFYNRIKDNTKEFVNKILIKICLLLSYYSSIKHNCLVFPKICWHSSLIPNEDNYEHYCNAKPCVHHLLNISVFKNHHFLWCTFVISKKLLIQTVSIMPWKLKNLQIFFT